MAKPAARARRARVDLNRRRRQHANVDHLAAGRQKTAVHGVLQHRPGGPGVAANHHSARAHIGAERLRERAGQPRIEEFADDAADSGNADLQKVFTHA